MAWPTFLSGIFATVCAAVQILGWITLGSILFKKIVRENPLLGALAGAASCACVSAIFCRAGFAHSGCASTEIMAFAALLIRWRIVLEIATSIAQALRQWLTVNRALKLLLILTFILYWLIAITPPREGDAMRYHLAHVRQIDRENIWESIPDWNYAQPFGWSLNYLPFEHLGIPQTAQLINLGMLILCAASLFAWLASFASPLRAALGTAVFCTLPLMIKVSTTPIADMSAIAAALAGIILLDQALKTPHPSTFFALGFSAWIGVQSRYQAIAGGLTFSFIVLLAAAKKIVPFKALQKFVLGALVALSFAAPFLLANLLTFRNPVWPLLVRQINGQDSYLHRMAADEGEWLAGHLDRETLSESVPGLLFDPGSFPLYILALALLPFLLRRDLRLRALVLFVAVFGTLWTLVHPMFFPKYGLQMFPAALGAWVLILENLQRPLFKKILTAALSLAVGAYFCGIGWYSTEHLRFLATNELSRYHRHTWFYNTWHWCNFSLPPDARVLVIVSGANSYHLKSYYRRADPRWSGVVDWEAIDTSAKLAAWMKQNHFDTIVFEDRDWSSHLRGAEMSAVLHAAIADGTLREIHAQQEVLRAGRMLEHSTTSTVRVLSISR